MFVAICIIRIELYDSDSLKYKRNILRSIKDNTRRHYNAAISEVGELDAINKSILSIVSVSNDARHLNGRIDKIINNIERKFPGLIFSHELNIENYELI